MRGRKERGASFHTENTDPRDIRDWKLLTEEQVKGVGFGADAENNTNISLHLCSRVCQLEKKKSHNPKVELFSLVEKLEASKLGRQHLSSLEKAVQEVGGWSQAIYKFARSRQSEHQRLW